MNLEQLWTSVLRIGLSKVRHGWRSGWWLKRPFRLMTELLSADRFREEESLSSVEHTLMTSTGSDGYFLHSTHTQMTLV